MYISPTWYLSVSKGTQKRFIGQKDEDEPELDDDDAEEDE
jgi:hypothetical protein